LPLVLSIAIGISLNPSRLLYEWMYGSVYLFPTGHGEPLFSLFAVIIYALMIGPLMVAISYFSFHLGYERGPEAVIAILGSRTLKRFETLAQWLGAFALGALAAMPTVTGLRLRVLSGEARQALNIVLPLALILLLYVLRQRFQVRPTLILLVLVVAGLFLALIGLV